MEGGGSLARPHGGGIRQGGSGQQWCGRDGGGRWSSGTLVREQGRGRLAVGREGMTGGPGPGKEKKEKENRFNSNLKLIFQIYSNLIRSQQDLPGLENFEIKYSWKEFEIRNNFPYRNFVRFLMDFEQKFREASIS
jgi:hypothetical protein